MSKKKDGVSNYSVYKLTLPNGKSYVGMTKKPLVIRWNNGKGYVQNKLLYKDIVHYGWDNVIKEVLFEGSDKKESSAKETEFILKYNTNDKSFGYNTIVNLYKPVHLNTDYIICKTKNTSKKISKEGGVVKKNKYAVMQFTLEGEFIREFKDRKDASEFTGILTSTLGNYVVGNYSIRSKSEFLWLERHYVRRHNAKLYEKTKNDIYMVNYLLELYKPAIKIKK